MEEIELTAEELYKKKIKNEFERLKNLPKTEIILTEEQIQTELKRAKNLERIRELKQLLASQDYKTIKYMQGELTEEEFEKVKAQCKSWRDEINKLEQEQVKNEL